MPGHVRDFGKRKDRSTKWQVRWRHPDDASIRVEKVIPGDKRRATKYLNKLESDALDGGYMDPRRADRPFREVIEAWRDSWPDRYAASTQERYAQSLRARIEPEFASRRTSQITYEVVRRWVSKMRDEGMAPATVKKHYTVLSAAMTEAIRMGVVRIHPCRYVTMPKVKPEDRKERIYLTAAEVRQLAETIHPHYRVLVYTAAATGLRFSELAGLRRRDLDGDLQELRVEQTLTGIEGGEPRFGRPKTRTSRRTVALPAFLKGMLAEHLTSAPGGDDADALVFTTVGGQRTKAGERTGERRPLDGQVFRRRYFQPAVKAALPPEKREFTFHGLRHTHAALLISRGAHLQEVKQRMGHANVAMTSDVYGHLFPSAETGMARALDAEFAAGEQEVAQA